MINNSGNKLNKFVLVSAIGLVFGLTSCGGGGGDSTYVPPSTITVDGTAAKGIVKDGVVTAKELSASGDVIATVGSATTGNDGTYSLTLNDNYNGGPIQISITADGNTQTKCDVPIGCGTRTDGMTDSTPPDIDFGEWYKPVALTMTALVPDAEANETLSVSVTPFTHMAAARAEAASTLDATAIANANSEVSNLLGGIDILNTPPVDITDSTAISGASSAAQVTYAALASALSNQGFVDADGQPDLNAAIDLLASSFVTGIIEADDSDGDDAAQISLQEIVTAAEETLAEAGIIDLTGILDGLQAAIDYAEDDGDGTIDPEPSTTVADPDLDKVKAMVSDVRTWGNVIVAETEVRGSAFETQVSLASDAVSIFGTADPVDVLDACLEAALNATSGTTDLVDYELGLNNFSNGTIDSTSGVITITGGVVHGYTVDMVINLPVDGASGTSFSLGISSATISSPSNVLTINNGLATVTFASDFTVVYADIADPLIAVVLPVTTDLTFDLDNIAFTQNVDSSGNPLASPVTFEGALSTDLDAIPVINDPLDTLDDDEAALPKTLKLSGVISNTLGDSVTAILAVNVTNTATFMFVGDAYPVGTLYSDLHGEPMIQWTYADTDSTAGDDTFTYISPYQNQSLYWNETDGSVTNSYTYMNYFTNLSDLVANNVYIWDDYQYVAGEGQYFFSAVGADVTVDGFVDGVLEFSEDPVNYPVGTLYSANHSPVYYWAYTDTDAIAGNDTFTITRIYGSESYYWNAADNSITQSNTYPSSATSLAEALINSGYYPYDISIWIDGEGRYYASVASADFSVDGEVLGTLIEPDFIEETDTADGWIDADIGLTFVAQLDGLPEARINITADRTGFEAGEGQVTVSYDNRQLVLSATASNGQIDGLLTITNQDNVVLNLDFTETDLTLLSGGLSFNGVKYADVEETTSGYLKISYIDGTFEIF